MNGIMFCDGRVDAWAAHFRRLQNVNHADDVNRLLFKFLAPASRRIFGTPGAAWCLSMHGALVASRYRCATKQAIFLLVTEIFVLSTVTKARKMSDWNPMSFDL